MRFSEYFIPTQKENPVDATIKSHQLMLKAGMIRQQSSGIYYWLPLGLKILKKISHIISTELEKDGYNELLMPCIQPASLWQESGRYDAYGKEMLKITDRHSAELLFGPTNEESITDIFRKNIFSYKELPKKFFHIQWKFRDEIRPRYGVMRGREFLMKDGYSFDLTQEDSEIAYKQIFCTYLRIFAKMGLTAIPVKADTGAIGGNLSHEFHIKSPTGESKIYYDKSLEQITQQENFIFEDCINLYSAADDMHNLDNCNIDKNNLVETNSIEVGHIFCFGDKYTKSMNATILNQDGKLVHPFCGSYGIGVSRLIAAFIEINHDDNGIIWPKEVSPFDISLINLNIKDELCNKISEELYLSLKEKYDILYDETDNRAGTKFSTHDLLGFPWQIIVGPKLSKNGNVEIKNRRTSEKFELEIQEVENFLKRNNV
jgi:prolyl-tRNA synthetase